MNYSEDGSAEEEHQKEVYKYFTTESYILPKNQTTEKQLQELREKKRLEMLHNKELEQKQRVQQQIQKERDKENRERMRAEAEKRRQQEIKKEEEKKELKDLKGFFGITILEMKANNTALEMVMTGTNFTPPQRRLIYRALETNTSLKVKK